MYILNFQPIKCHLIIIISLFFSHPVFSHLSPSLSELVVQFVCMLMISAPKLPLWIPHMDCHLYVIVQPIQFQGSLMFEGAQ